MKRFWKTTGNVSDGWHARLKFGRVQVGYHVYKHRNSALCDHMKTVPDRWAFQPFVIFDRKRI